MECCHEWLRKPQSEKSYRTRYNFNVINYLSFKITNACETDVLLKVLTL
jgi:hypothetical protein